MQNLEDRELVSRYKSQPHPQIIAELYQRYSKLVFGSCLKYLKNVQDTEDAVSDIFELVSKKLQSHNVAYFKSWLYTVTRNHCIEVLRKKNRHADKKNTSEFMYTEAVFHPDEVEDAQMLKALATCLEALPLNQQKCIRMFYYEKVGYKVIAEQLDMNWNKVRSFIQNGRRNLKNCITASTISIN